MVGGKGGKVRHNDVSARELCTVFLFLQFSQDEVITQLYFSTCTSFCMNSQDFRCPIMLTQKVEV